MEPTSLDKLTLEEIPAACRFSSQARIAGCNGPQLSLLYLPFQDQTKLELHLCTRTSGIFLEQPAGFYEAIISLSLMRKQSSLRSLKEIKNLIFGYSHIKARYATRTHTYMHAGTQTPVITSCSKSHGIAIIAQMYLFYLQYYARHYCGYIFSMSINCSINT